jgi:hypothetical protein
VDFYFPALIIWVSSLVHFRCSVMFRDVYAVGRDYGSTVARCASDMYIYIYVYKKKKKDAITSGEC